MTRNLRGRRAGKQAQLPRNNAIEREAAILEERSLGGVVKMAAPTEKGNSGAMLSVKRVLAEGQKAEEGREREEDVIVISDEEPEGQESFSFGGKPGSLAVHQDARRHAGGQSLPVKARALLVHRKEGRVNSGAVYPTTREAGVRCSLGHSAGSILDDEQPSTSWGAGAVFDMQEETLLDYEEDEEEQNVRVAVPV
ncbi:hypothetical protein NDU88_004531 [Pleurodeles waltl]|uniref:Uncharacterized protein n=1 Tax=Pleurodeles waltl TaxID=8319 RepID=A0AAV7RJJ6_PLEWA|nr:hypothetical protein NDU88_004531 [Pleurodeles waltl]